jgi:hypothetical protein
MTHPTEVQLRQWWYDQQRFFETKIGRTFAQLMYQAQHMQNENEVYKKHILGDAALLPPVFKEMK